MMDISRRIKAFSQAGQEIERLLKDDSSSMFRERFLETPGLAQKYNRWFTDDSIRLAFAGITKMLEGKELERWTGNYPIAQSKKNPVRVGVIMAGNIPMVGFHDFLCILVSGNKVVAKLSSDDKELLPFIADILLSIEPAFEKYITFTERLTTIDAVIATGSNNSSRYFDYYFSKYPHIFRANRNAVGIITDFEEATDLEKLGSDVFSYFGLGCRNVSKVYVPEGYDFAKLFEAFQSFDYVMQHNKYMNNYDYHRTLYLMNQTPFLTNNFISIKEDRSLLSPVSVLHYETYSGFDVLRSELKKREKEIQCIVSKPGIIERSINFGETQFPSVSDYADGVDTMEFLCSLPGK